MKHLIAFLMLAGTCFAQEFPVEHHDSVILDGTIAGYEAEIAALRKQLEASRPAPTDRADPLPVTRPVVRVYTLEWRNHDKPNSCPPCMRLYAASREPDFPYELKWLPPEPWVKGFPTLHWQDAGGVWRQQTGWHDLASFLKVYPPPQQAFQAAGGQSLVDTAGQYLGASGAFVLQPDAAVNATLSDGTKVSYTRVSGRYTNTSGVVSVTLDQPLPRVDVRKFGLHFGAAVTGAEYPDAQGNATAITTRGRYTVRIEGVE